MTEVGAEFERRFAELDTAYQGSLSRAFLERFRRSPWIRLVAGYAALRGGERVLEAGCGGGKFSVCLASLGCDVVALDYSKRMLRQARSLKVRAEAWWGPLSVEFVQGDITSLNLNDGSFDLTLNEGVVEHWLDREERLGVLAEMARVTRDGGSLAVFVPNGSHPLHRWWELSGYPGYREAPPMTLYSAAQLRAELEAVGCRSVLSDGIGAWASLAQLAIAALSPRLRQSLYSSSQDSA